MRISAILAITLSACTSVTTPPEEPSAHPDSVPVNDELTPTVIVPAFALIPTGPESARILWVPWETQVDYSVEVYRDNQWNALPATINIDSAEIDALSDGDQIRVVANNNRGLLGASVSFNFTPTSGIPTRFKGRNLIDGRGLPWSSTPTTITGTGQAPLLGDLLLLSLGPDTLDQGPREALSVKQHGSTWVATTRAYVPQEAAVGGLSPSTPDRSRGGVSINLSKDGLPKQLGETRPGYEGYCSASGWGCLEFSTTAPGLSVPVEPDGDSHERSTDWYSLVATSLSWTHQLQGLDLTATAEGGVQVQLDYDYTLFPRIELTRVAARAKPYVGGDLSASIDTTTESIIFEQPLWASGEVTLLTAYGILINADFGLTAAVEFQSDAPVQGSWNGAVDLSKTYEVGYRAQNFYGPSEIASLATVQITPTFGDGSAGDLWVGWRAEGAVIIKPFSFEVARATLTPSVGVVLNHASTDGAPCNQPISILHSHIDTLARLDAGLNILYFGERSFRLAEKRTPLLGWGRPFSLSMSPRAVAGSSLEFRLKPGPEPVFGSGRVDVAQPLHAFLDGAPVAALTQLDHGRYSLSPTAAELSSPTPTFSLWLPDDNYPGTDLLAAPGACISTSLIVEAH